MAWDTEGTKRAMLDAAVAEFAAHGPDGTTIERIARAAGVNKERVYNYFGGKPALFATVLRDELAKVARDVPADSFSTEDIGDYAGRVYDYHRAHPELGGCCAGKASPSTPMSLTRNSGANTTCTRPPPSPTGRLTESSPQSSTLIT